MSNDNFLVFSEQRLYRKGEPTQAILVFTSEHNKKMFEEKYNERLMKGPDYYQTHYADIGVAYILLAYWQDVTNPCYWQPVIKSGSIDMIGDFGNVIWRSDDHFDSAEECLRECASWLSVLLTRSLTNLQMNLLKKESESDPEENE